MSADNFIGVVKTAKGFYVTEGSMSILLEYQDSLEPNPEFPWPENEQPYAGSFVSGPYESEDEAEQIAGELFMRETIVEYGIQSTALPDDADIEKALRINDLV